MSLLMPQHEHRQLCLTQAYEDISDGVQSQPTMSTSAVLECEAGSQVWVQMTSYDCYVYGYSEHQRSSFGGFLVQPL